MADYTADPSETKIEQQGDNLEETPSLLAEEMASPMAPATQATLKDATTKSTEAEQKLAAFRLWNPVRDTSPPIEAEFTVRTDSSMTLELKTCSEWRGLLGAL